MHLGGGGDAQGMGVDSKSKIKVLNGEDRKRVYKVEGRSGLSLTNGFGAGDLGCHVTCLAGDLGCHV